MRVLSFKRDHDGTIACIEDEELVFSIEAEKNNFYRHSWIIPNTFVYGLRSMRGIPDVVALSGWTASDNISALYGGLDRDSIKISDSSFCGFPAKIFSSSHERSHLVGTFAMSPFPQGTPCYALLWEGGFGSFYEVDSELNFTRLTQVMAEPGERYALLYHIASDSEQPFSSPGDAGKLMALAAFSDRSALNKEETDFINRIMRSDYHRYSEPKQKFADSPFYKIGVEHEKTKQLAGKLTDYIFEQFYSFAERVMNKRLPLIITGGCGLNCEWNTRFKNCGLFPEVFVPPCANDSGSALGTAIDAQFILTGKSKIKWNVYAGEEFIIDTDKVAKGFTREALNYETVANKLAHGKIIAWVQGKYEIGPRALGNRSLLAAPFDAATHARLNQIKQREMYRPIAPICLEEDVHLHFEWSEPSPYMLYFQKVRSRELQAVTHIDGTARVQTVTKTQNAPMYELLQVFRKTSGVGVLCNTSLNFLGNGFINQMSHLIQYVNERSLDGYVVGDQMYFKAEHS